MIDPREDTAAAICAFCRWFKRKQDTPNGRCRKHAPTMDGFPSVLESDWCGDFRLDHRGAK